MKVGCEKSGKFERKDRCTGNEFECQVHIHGFLQHIEDIQSHLYALSMIKNVKSGSGHHPEYTNNTWKDKKKGKVCQGDWEETTREVGRKTGKDGFTVVEISVQNSKLIYISISFVQMDKYLEH